MSKSTHKRLKQGDIITETKTKSGSDKTITINFQLGKLLKLEHHFVYYEMTDLRNNNVYTSKIYPKKLLSKNDERTKNIVTEIKCLKKLKHPNIAKLVYYFEDNEFVYLLFERLPEKTLQSYLKQKSLLSEGACHTYIKKLVSTLMFLHQNKIAHGNLKLDNIYLTERFGIKIEGFEKVRMLTPDEHGKLSSEDEVAVYSDILSLGEICYWLVEGRAPCYTHKMNPARIIFQRDIYLSQEARNFIRTILDTGGENIPSLEQISHHAFLQRDLNKPIMLDSPKVKRRDLNKAILKKSLFQTFLSINNHVEDELYVLSWARRPEVCFAYVLSTGRVGGLFEDGSAILIEAENSIYSIEDGEINHYHSVIERLYGKVDFMYSTIRTVISQQEIDRIRKDHPSPCELIYVKDWINKEQSWLLKLSNGMMQLHHNDAQVMFSGGKELITEDIGYGGCDEEVLKLIKKAKELLSEMKSID